MKPFGIDLKIPAPFERYLAIKRSFVSKAITILSECGDSASDNEFADAWQSSDRASIHEGATTWGKWLGRKKLMWIARQLNEELISKGVFDYDEERITNEFLTFDAIDDCAAKGQSVILLKLIEEHEHNLETERQTRVDRARNSWEGGTLGGGIKGAIKGALNAEALNIGGALICGAFNKIGRHFSRKEWLDESRQVFNAFKIELYGAIYDDILSNLDGVVACRKKLLHEKICCEWPHQNAEKASGILGNFRDDRIPLDQVERAAYELIKANPMDSDAYDWLYTNHKTLRKDIKKLTEHFCVNVPSIIQEEKLHQSKKVKTKQRVQSQDTGTAKEVKQEDTALRTAFGRVWDSLGEADSARRDRHKFLQCAVELIKRHQGEDRDIALGDDLTDDLTASLRATFAPHENETILAALNTCLFRSYDYGAIFTTLGIRWKNKNESLSKRRSLSWHIFGTADEKLRIKDRTELVLARKAILDLDYAANRSEKWLTIFSELRNYWQEATFVNPDTELFDID